MSHLYGQPAATVSASASPSPHDASVTGAAAETDDSSFVQSTRPAITTTAAAFPQTHSQLLAAARAWKRQRVETVSASANDFTTVTQPTDGPRVLMPD